MNPSRKYSRKNPTSSTDSAPKSIPEKLPPSTPRASASRSCENSPMPPISSTGRSWVNPASPMPTTLPNISSVGRAALIMISMIRELFSSTTPCATHRPYTITAMYITSAET